jgi:hypothetical protein
MRATFLILLIAIGLHGCTVPTQLPVSEKAQPADTFARDFIDKIIAGQVDSALSYVDPEVLNEESITFITNASRNIHAEKVKTYRVVEQNYTYAKALTGNTGERTIYKLGYEYEFDRGNILFTTTIKEEDSRLSVIAFNGEFLQAPLAELTKFTFENKTPVQYVFLLVVILVPVFILTTLICMLLSKMTKKKKLIWAVIILACSIIRFSINWGDGQMDFQLLNFNIQGFSFYKPTLYSAWILAFNVPVGAILFWIRRRSLLAVEHVVPVKNNVSDESNSSEFEIPKPDNKDLQSE